MLIYGTGAVVAATSPLGLEAGRKMRKLLEDNGIMSPDLSEEEKADILAFHLNDWRDVNSAEAIFLLSQTAADWQSEVPLFQGGGHGGIYEYLRKPELRELKRSFYLPYNIVGNNNIRRYHFDKEKGFWELASEIPY
jgi:hypothetical protein